MEQGPGSRGGWALAVALQAHPCQTVENQDFVCTQFAFVLAPKLLQGRNWRLPCAAHQPCSPATREAPEWQNCTIPKGVP